MRGWNPHLRFISFPASGLLDKLIVLLVTDITENRISMVSILVYIARLYFTW